jgi:hypothetical protein
MSLTHPDCGTNLHGDSGLLELYTVAATQAERTLKLVEELVATVQGGGDFESQWAALQSCCSQIAEVEARIQAAQGRVSLEDHESGQRILAAAERHMKVLSQLCDRIRDAEQAATIRLQTLGPGLDASIRGKQMIAAYRQRR